MVVITYSSCSHHMGGPLSVLPHCPTLCLHRADVPAQVDLYSLGVVVFEMWHRFSTAMERAVLLRELREAGKLPAAWESQHPQVARLIR